MLRFIKNFDGYILFLLVVVLSSFARAAGAPLTITVIICITAIVFRILQLYLLGKLSGTEK